MFSMSSGLARMLVLPFRELSPTLPNPTLIDVLGDQILFFLIIHIMVLACLGCQRLFDTSKGLKIHQSSCNSFTSTTRHLLLKRTQQQERPDAAKIARKDSPGPTDAGSASEGSNRIGALATVDTVPNVISQVSTILGSAYSVFSHPYTHIPYIAINIK